MHPDSLSRSASSSAMRASSELRHVGSTDASSSDGAHDWLRHALPADVFDVVMVGHNMLNQSGRPQRLPRLRGPQRRRDEHLHQPEGHVRPRAASRGRGRIAVVLPIAPLFAPSHAFFPITGPPLPQSFLGQADGTLIVLVPLKDYG